MKVLLIGSGGREHALAWKISQSKRLEKLFCAPGNPGTAQVAKNVPIKADDIDNIGALKKFALEEKIDFTVVGPEVPLSLGIVDEFVKSGLKIFGPTKGAAEIEASKVFCKKLLSKYKIPTAAYGEFDDVKKAFDYIDKKGAPLVVKADGLAAGKGVFICHTKDEARRAVSSVMEEKLFGTAGARVVIEEFLVGEEASYLVVTDGQTIVPLASAQDHKAVFDDDKGPNTGGMGAYSPAPIVTKELEKIVLDTIMKPVVKAMEKEGRPYKGVLYAGLMITANGPKVLEFNCRLGDPETQPILMRLKSDLLDFLLAATDNKLSKVTLDWDSGSTVCVVMCAKGYPADYEKDKPISGMEEAEKDVGVKVFHAGTRTAGGSVVTSGGRVLGVTALGKDIRDAIEKAYRAVDKVKFDNAHYRKDIGKKALIRNKA